MVRVAGSRYKVKHIERNIIRNEMMWVDERRSESDQR